MSRRIMKWLKDCHKAPIFSPKGFLARAVLIGAAFLICHAVGLRGHTAILSGTSPSGDPTDVFSVGLGTTYIVLYFAFVLVTPILIIASAVFALLQLGIARVVKYHAKEPRAKGPPRATDGGDHPSKVAE
jgi:hypothetical protein